MRHLLTILAALLLCPPAHAQTLKSLMFNSTNGVVTANTGTNVLTITNDTVVFQEGIVANKVKAPSGDVVSIDSWDNTSRITLDGNQIGVYTDILGIHTPITFAGTNASLNTATTRTNLSLGLPALTNTSNVTAMRALSGSTNTNHPYSGSISVVGTNNTNTLTFSNGILQSVE